MHPPARILISALGLTLLVGACATPQSGPSRATVEREQRRADCAARGGIIVPSGRPLTGRDELDDVCRIENASRLTP